ncbi:unnamed protein product [Parnassius apollo]|uniref:(apollo) hypothetical protein n=1 Tax=Parnassius apollo TaxID=110799 RepID=A0A8S3XED4_PARAO|nr:unnamed protein product [Parnassius apollo]
MPALFALDDYQFCMSHLEGVYCLARFDLHSDHPNELITLIKEYSKYQKKHYNHSHVERGICVTKTCRMFCEDKDLRKEVDLTDSLEKCFNKSMWEDYELKAKLSMIYYCDTYSEEEEIDSRDRIFMTTIIFILILNIAGNCYDIYVKKTGRNLNGLGHVILSSFSLKQNWKTLTSYESENPKIARLNGLHGLRSIITQLTLLAHSLFTITTFIDNPHEVEMSYEKPFYCIIYNGLVMMQIVFTISGFLLTYNLQIRSEKYEINWIYFPKILIMRLCRIVPAYATVLFFTSTWFKHLGSGPLWKLYGRGIADDCRNRWWHHLLFINNYTNMKNSSCLVQTWHVAAEMQLFTLGLAVHIATRHCGRRILLALLLLVGAASPALHVLLHDLDPLVLANPELFRENQNDTFFKMHILSHNNLAGHVAGMITGYLIYHMQQNGKPVRNSKLFSLLIWWILPASVYVFLLGNIFYIEGYEVSFAFKLLYAGTQRVFAGTIGAIIIIGLVFKLNVHMNIAFVILGTKTQLVHTSIFVAFMNYVVMATMSFIIPLPLYLTVEAPVNKMVKTIIDQQDDQYSKMKEN